MLSIKLSRLWRYQGQISLIVNHEISEDLGSTQSKYSFYFFAFNLNNCYKIARPTLLTSPKASTIYPFSNKTIYSYKQHTKYLRFLFIYLIYPTYYNFLLTYTPYFTMNKLCLLLVACMLILNSTSASPFGLYADLLLGLSDQGLFDAASVAGLTGNCRITRGTSSSACDLYAITRLDNGTWIGLPDLIGTGCVKAPDFPKHMNICWGPPNTYGNYNATSTPICTNSGIKNAANMIRIAINRGWCKLPICIGYPNCVKVAK